MDRAPAGLLIEARELGHRFAHAAVLSGVDLTIGAGEFVSIVGPSGCGKSTLLRLLAHLEQPTAGELAVAGQAPESKGGQRGVGFVFQAPTLLPWRTALANVALPLELEGREGVEAYSRARETLRLMRLAEADWEKLPHQLSGGMQMRVSLARAVATRPALLLLDEPFASLDDVLRQELHEELLALWQELEFTAVLVTHNIAEAVFLSQRVLLLQGVPSRIRHEVVVPFDYPRDAVIRSTSPFAQLTGEVLALLRQSDKVGA